VLIFERWEEERYPEGIKWKFLEHKDPVFAPPYESLPDNVKFYYDGELFQGFLILDQEKSLLLFRDQNKTKHPERPYIG
jgi:hypothetical protein